MSAEKHPTKAALTPFGPQLEQKSSTPQRRRSDYVCSHCDLPIGGSFSVHLNSGRNLHLDCYLSIYQRPVESPVA